MTDENIHLTVPSELNTLLKKNIGKLELEKNRIILNTYKGNKICVENDGNKLMEDRELYAHMANNFDWLVEYIGTENPYERESYKFNSKIGHMLGVTREYLSESVLFEKESSSEVESDDSDEIDSIIQRIDSGKNKYEKLEVNNHKNEKEKENVFDFDLISGDSKIFDNLKKILENAPNPPDFKDTLMYQYMKPRSGPFIDTSGIEKEMIKNGSNKKMTNLLRTAFDKSSLEDYIELVKQFSNKKSEVNNKDIKSIPTWKSWVLNGFHLIFTGSGSNRNVINTFTNVALRDGPVLLINGYMIKGSDSYLWNYLNDKIVGTKCLSKSEALKRIANKVELMTSNFYLVVHGMDHFLINEGFNTLKSLIELENVKVIGSISHHNSGPILSEFDQILGKYRIIETDTGEDYTEELISIWQNNPPNFLVNKKTQKRVEQIQSILDALSQNHQKLFSLIAQIQIEHVQDNKRFIGIEKNSILNDSRAITICHNESKLDNLLTEFTTHEVIEQTRGPGGRLFLKIPFENHQLEKFVN